MLPDVRGMTGAVTSGASAVKRFDDDERRVTDAVTE